MENHYFKTAEFAALCGVRKDTLLHYDHIGLLKPQWVGENGYRYYAAQQLRTYDLIAALRRLGTPLAEIRDYLTRRSPQALLALLEEKEAQLAEERRRLEAVSRLLQTAMDTTRLAQQVQPGEIRLRSFPRPTAPWWRPRTLPAGSLRRPGTSSTSASCWPGPGSTAPSPWPLGTSSAGRAWRRGTSWRTTTSAWCPREPRGGPSGCGRGGTYAVLYHQGSYQSEYAACRQLWEWVHAQGYPVDGDLYEENLVDYTTSEDPRGYLLKLSLKIQLP